MKFKNAVLMLCSVLLLTSCGASKKKVAVSETASEERIELNPKTRGEMKEEPREERGTGTSLAINISEHAKTFLGTSYRYGGSSRDGMDCSGLVYTAFLEENIELPRISREMSLLGTRLYLKEVGIGDLLFFETDKNRKVINHVGLVVETREEEIFFIHSSTSKGVIISSLKQPYWEEHFVMARRVL